MIEGVISTLPHLHQEHSDSASGPSGVRGRFIYKDNATAGAGGGHFKDRPEGWLGPDGHYGLLFDGCLLSRLSGVRILPLLPIFEAKGRLIQSIDLT